MTRMNQEKEEARHFELTKRGEELMAWAESMHGENAGFFVRSDLMADLIEYLMFDHVDTGELLEKCDGRWVNYLLDRTEATINGIAGSTVIRLPAGGWFEQQAH